MKTNHYGFKKIIDRLLLMDTKNMVNITKKLRWCAKLSGVT